MALIDGTTIRAHQKAAGAEKAGADSQERDAREALGRSRGGYGSTAWVIADGRGRAVAFALAPGQAHERPLAPGLLGCLPDVPGWVVGDRGFASDAFRARIWDLGARPAIPPKRTDAPVACPDWIYANRRLVENLWARLKGLGHCHKPGGRHPRREDCAILPRRALPRRHGRLAQVIKFEQTLNRVQFGNHSSAPSTTTLRQSLAPAAGGRATGFKLDAV